MKGDYLISKSNKLVISRYDLSLQEQRIILTLVSLLNPQEDLEFKEFEFKILDFCKLIGVESEKNHTHIKRTTEKLMSRVLKIQEEDRLLQINWISSCEYLDRQGIVKICFDKKLAPYLLQLKDKFTSYYLSNVLRMKSKHSIRLYELLKCYQLKSSFTLELDELKEMMKCESYKQYGHFKSRVIEQALKEINSQTDIFADYTEIKQGRRVVALEFKVESSSKLESELYWSEEKQDIFGEKYRQGLLL